MHVSRKTGAVLAAAAAGLALAAAPPARASTLSSTTSVTGLPAGSFLITNTLAPNNAPASIPLNQSSGMESPSGTTPVDFTFMDTNSGGVTGYAIEPIFFNQTGATITSISYQVGTGTGAGFVAFTSGPTQFQTTPAPTGGVGLTATTVTPYLITYTGSLTNANIFPPTFYLDTADQGGTPLTLRQTLNQSVTATPEPSSVAAFAFTALGVGGLLLRARRRRATPA